MIKRNTRLMDEVLDEIGENGLYASLTDHRTEYNTTMVFQRAIKRLAIVAGVEPVNNGEYIEITEELISLFNTYKPLYDLMFHRDHLNISENEVDSPRSWYNSYVGKNIILYTLWLLESKKPSYEIRAEYRFTDLYYTLSEMKAMGVKTEWMESIVKEALRVVDDYDLDDVLNPQTDTYKISIEGYYKVIKERVKWMVFNESAKEPAFVKEDHLDFLETSYPLLEILAEALGDMTARTLILEKTRDEGASVNTKSSTDMRKDRDMYIHELIPNIWIRDIRSEFDFGIRL